MGVEGINKAFYLLHGVQHIRSVIFFRKFVIYSSLNNQVTFNEDKVHRQDIVQIARQIVDKGQRGNGSTGQRVNEVLNTKIQ